MHDFKKILYLLLLWLFFFPNIFVASTSVNKQMQVQQCGSCGVQDFKKNNVFTTAMAVFVPKYIYGHYLYEQANVGIAMWKLWRVGFEK